MRMRRALVRQLDRFGQDEAGGVSMLAVGGLVVLLLIAGVAIDVTNVFRHRSVMQMTTDAAAHAGLVRLVQGASPDEAVKQSLTAIESNMPLANYGPLVGNSDVDLQVLHYDLASNSLSPADLGLNPANAVVTRLQRSAAVGNRLPSLVMGLLGQGSWDMATTAVAALVPVQRCSNAEGLFAQGEIRLVPGSVLGADVCLHSQTSLRAPPGVRFQEGAKLSMPDLAACDADCLAATEEAGRAEMNILMPAARDHVLRLAEGFASPRKQLPEEADFFAGKSLPEDLSALDEVGIPIEKLRLGSVVSLSATAFNQMRAHPGGLVYRVACEEGMTGLAETGRPWDTTLMLKKVAEDVPETDIPTASAPSSGASAGGPEDLPPEEYAELIPPSEGGGAVAEDRVLLQDLVLVTNCAVEMDDTVLVTGSLLILTGPTPDTRLSVAPGTLMGDPDQTCLPELQTTLMTTGSLRLPGFLAQSNLAVVAGGDLVIETDGKGRGGNHMGASFHAGGRIDLVGAHSFTGCGQPHSSLLPPLQVIAHVMPPLHEILPPIPHSAPVEVDMPGEKVKQLPRTPGPEFDSPIALTEEDTADGA